MILGRSLSVCCVLGTVALTLGGCAEKQTTRPLVDSFHAADVLVERHVLSDPRSVDRNRLLRGWRFHRQSGGHRWVPSGPESVVEFVNLKNRPRSLEIQAAVDDPGTQIRVRIRWKDRELGEFEVTEGATIPLPADLPLGRIALTLEFSSSDGIAVERISIAPSVAAGEVRISSNGIEQSGWSVVEVVRRVQPGARMIVGFEPAPEPESRQRFSIMVERERGDPREVFSWRSGEESDLAGSQRVEAALGDEAGFVRIRLIGEGHGRPARWIEPRIIEREEPRGACRSPVRRSAAPPRRTLRHGRASCGSRRAPRRGWHPTPNIGELAAGGATFENHFAVAPNTPPSTRALFSGLCMLDDRQLPSPGPRRLAEVFREAGISSTSLISSVIPMSNTTSPAPTNSRLPGFVLGSRPGSRLRRRCNRRPATRSWMTRQKTSSKPSVMC